MRRRQRASLLVVVLASIGCGGAPGAPDAAVDAVVDADDGPPIRRPCTDAFGTEITQSFGRLDGYLVSIVPAGTGRCNADPSHVHLQILANGAVYDAAINVGSTAGVEDVHTTTRELPLPGPAWAEGWHTGLGNSYVSLGLHDADLALASSAEVAAAIDLDLATANHISVFGTGYGPEGIHLVHHQVSGRDGMVLTQVLSTPARARLFSFTNQTF